MIIKLNTEGTISILPVPVPEPLDNIYLSYIFPKGLNHLTPVLTWGGVKYEGQNKHIAKTPTRFDMKVSLYNGGELYKTYILNTPPKLYIGYEIERLEPNLLSRLRELEIENKELKERGDIL